MNGSRRRLLAATGGLATALAGCLSSVPGGPGSASGPPDGESGATTETTETTPPTTDYPETVEATATIDREDLEYVESNDTVRYVAAWRANHSGETPTRDPVYDYEPFDEWVEVECASVAAKRVGEAMGERLGGDDEGVTVGVTTESGERAVFVAHQTMLNRDGDVISKPAVSYDRVKRVAPERAEVTVSFAGRTRERTVAVTTRERTVRQA